MMPLFNFLGAPRLAGTLLRILTRVLGDADGEGRAEPASRSSSDSSHPLFAGQGSPRLSGSYPDESLLREVTFGRDFDSLTALSKLGDHPEAAQVFWNTMRTRLEAEGVPIPDDLPQTPSELPEYLRTRGIHFPIRLGSLRTLLTILSNRESLPRLGRERPIALIIAPRTDYNGAFGQYPLYDRFVQSDLFDVLYYEAPTDQEAAAILERVRKETGRRIHTLVVAGHGSPTTLMLENPSEATDADPLLIDTGDFVEGQFRNLRDQIQEGGQVLLWSCSNGQGEERATNLANLFAQALPGRRVHSVQEPSNIIHLSIRPDRTIDVDWWKGTHPYVAFVEGTSL